MALIDNRNDSELLVKKGAETIQDEYFSTYIKPVSMKHDKTGFAVCTEDGVNLAVFASYEAAFYAARQHNLTPARLH